MPSRDAKTEEKSPIIARHSGFRRASHRHLNSGVHTSPFVRYLSTCICSLGHIRCHRSEHHDAKWVQTTLVNLFHTTYPKSPSYRDSRQPRLSSGSRRGSSALSVIIRQFAIRTHIAGARTVKWLRVGH